ncbi:MAG TPA: hypothetical protein VFD69_14470 [Vicinamibacterales bacterium]|nr:hypothetical protein [Vicinamibacterales bacterium]
MTSDPELAQHVELANAVAKAMRQADPLGLLHAGSDDDYDSETAAVLSRLLGAYDVDDVAAILGEEFSRMSGFDVAALRVPVESLATRIWNVLVNYRLSG